MVQYDASSRTLLNELNDGLLALGEAVFVPWTVSKIGAFYLASTLFVESEMRLLVKRHTDAPLPTMTDHAGEYLPVQTATSNEYCYVEIIEVAFGGSADEQALKASLKGTRLQNVPLTGP